MNKGSDLIGQKFNLLTVISQEPSANKRTYWRCRCDCGNEIVVVRNNLTRGNTSSCGCLRRGQVAKYTPLEAAFRRYQLEARRRGKVFELTFEQFELLVLDRCFYCGSPPSIQMRRTKQERNSIDRKDNSKGYILGNVVTSCWNCNNMKGTFSSEEFIEAARTIADYQESKLREV